MINARLERLNDYPFQRLADLLKGNDPRSNDRPIMLHIGEPQHQPPDFAIDIIAGDRKRWNLYPPVVGRQACANPARASCAGATACRPPRSTRTRRSPRSRGRARACSWSRCSP